MLHAFVYSSKNEKNLIERARGNSMRNQRYAKRCDSLMRGADKIKNIKIFKWKLISSYKQ